MDAIAVDGASAVALEDPKRFWEEVEEVLHIDEQSNGSAETIDEEVLALRLNQFFAICSASYDVHLTHARNCDYLLSRLVESPLIQQSPREVCAARLTTLAVSAKSLPSLLMIYDTLLKLSVGHSSLFRSSGSATQLIPRLVHHFWAARFSEEYNERHHAKAASAASNGKTGHHKGEPSADWNIRHVRAVSSGSAVRQVAEQRDRNIQIQLKERSVQLLYEICRSRHLGPSEMKPIDATFINHLFDLVETSRNWHDDTFNYQVIRLVVALNEQFMVSSIAHTSSRKSAGGAANTVLTVLRTRLNASKTFGENIIFMLNRTSSLDAEDVCVQLLILKLLYLLFTTKETAHYFYTNDLKVLVDIFIRELSDLSEEHESLRHTYLRVLHPLLTNTQLLTYPYKRPQIRHLLTALVSHGHVREISPTTKRLVERCLGAQWCVDLDQGNGDQSQDETKHHFAVQSIKGGQTTIVEATAVVDSEGVAVPVGKDSQPILGAPSTDAAIAEVLHESDGDEGTAGGQGHSRSPTLTVAALANDGAQATSLHEPQMRAMRVQSVIDLPSDVRRTLNDFRGSITRADTFSDTDSAAHSMVGSMTLHDGSGEIVESPTHEQDPHLSPPNGSGRSFSALGMSPPGDSAEEENGAAWSGSPTESWHQGMSESSSPPSSLLVQAVRNSRSRADSVNIHSVMQSPLRESMTTGNLASALTADETSTTRSVDVPLVRVNGSDAEPSRTPDSQGGQGDVSPAGSAIQSSRRRPPAPPTGEGRGSARHAHLRRLGLHPSPSESTLTRPDEVDSRPSSATSRQDVAMTTTADQIYRSTPNTPGESTENSRSNSPLPDALGDTGSASGSIGRRRRPPPPPVDRSTKLLVRSDAHPQPPHSAPAPSQEATEADAGSVAPTTATKSDRRLSHYMRHLHLSSEGGYGW